MALQAAVAFIAIPFFIAVQLAAAAEENPETRPLVCDSESTIRVAEISRRRRVESMCSCRRRSAPNCVNDKVVLEGPSENAIKVMSYNLFGWNAFNRNDWRSEHVLNKIKAWGPDVLGAQEVETGGSQGYHEVANRLAGETLLEENGGSQFFDSSALEVQETASSPLENGYWISMTRFKHKTSEAYFLFFNSHWAHGYGIEQAQMVADFVHAQRVKYNSAPSILVGDTNQFCHGYESDAWRYLLGQNGSSPVVFEDVIDHDQNRSFSDYRNPNCRVDVVFATKDEWIVRQSDIDRDGMGLGGIASDHAPLMAELFPIIVV
jgi:endonuclease/exonuclease/phosphatase family metal-dependent hydrolase